MSKACQFFKNFRRSWKEACFFTAPFYVPAVHMNPLKQGKGNKQSKKTSGNLWRRFHGSNLKPSSWFLPLVFSQKQRKVLSAFFRESSSATVWRPASLLGQL